MAGPPHIPLATSRRRPAPTGDEEASNTLRLGEMTDVQTLSVAEANELLKFIEDKRKREGLEINNKDIYVKSRDYVNLFARFKDRETVEQVERESLAIPGVTKFERAQLGRHHPQHHHHSYWRSDQGPAANVDSQQHYAATRPKKPAPSSHRSKARSQTMTCRRRWTISPS